MWGSRTFVLDGTDYHEEQVWLVNEQMWQR